MGRPRINLIGERFGRLVVVEPLASASSHARFRTRCDCGNVSEQSSHDLRSGKVNSCGCLRRELTARRARTHGLTGTPEYRVWSGIIRRCENPADPNFKWYGAKGIGICKRWRESFAAFFEDMGPRPSPDHQIDRAIPSLGYRPQNCTWATPPEAHRHQAPRTRCVRGHLFSDDNTYLSPKGHRRCMICRRARREERKARLLGLRRAALAAQP